jgi:zinc protease
MRWTRTLFACAALAVAVPASAELSLQRAEVMHLPNGLTVILLEDHSFPLVSVQMLYKSGSAAEITGKTGLAHFLEHLAFRASERFPNARATELIYDAGGEWHGYTAMDQTTYFATMPKGGLDLLLRIEADRMARTVIDPASISAEKGAVITELHSYENDPVSVLQEAVTRTAIRLHPYGSPMAGYVSDVERLTIDDARAYYASHYAPGNAVLTIVGDFKPSEARALVATDFADVPARPVAAPNPAAEPLQAGERRIRLSGAVERQYFQLAFPAPAASSPDFPAFLVLQEILSGGSGVNLRQTDWAPTTRAVQGALLFGVSDDIATWLPPTRDPFLFMIGGSIESNADEAALERAIGKRLASLRGHPVSEARLIEAKLKVSGAVAGDVETTEDAAHQLAFFEGVGALPVLLDLPRRVAAVTPADIQRIARTYFAPGRATTGWMVPGTPDKLEAGSTVEANPTGRRLGAGSPRRAADRTGTPPLTGPAGPPQLGRLSGGFPAIVRPNPLSNAVTVELLLSAPVEGGASPADLPGLDAMIRSGTNDELGALIGEIASASRSPGTVADTPSEDPATRLEQLILMHTVSTANRSPVPMAVIVSGNVNPKQVFAKLETAFGDLRSGTLPGVASAPPSAGVVRERIAKPLAQGGLGYVVEGPPPGTREALAWRMLLYVLTHDYSGRLGNSAIRDRGLVYHIYSLQRSDGRRSWVTISTGVDPDKADAMEAELRAQLARLATDPPTPQEVEAARNHLLGRDVTAAQSNEEWTAKLAREFVETGGLRSHAELSAQLQSITPADLAAVARDFGRGTIIRVDVGAK